MIVLPETTEQEQSRAAVKVVGQSGSLSDCFHHFAGQESEEHVKWTKIWTENPVLEGLYMKRREARLAVQKLVAAAPEGDCAEECRTAEELPHLSDMSQDLLKLANRPTFKVGSFKENLCPLTQMHAPPQGYICRESWASLPFCKLPCLA